MGGHGPKGCPLPLLPKPRTPPPSRLSRIAESAWLSFLEAPLFDGKKRPFDQKEKEKEEVAHRVSCFRHDALFRLRALFQVAGFLKESNAGCTAHNVRGWLLGGQCGSA